MGGTSLLKGMGGHHTTGATQDEWLTPPTLIRSLGQFDLDPCAPVVRPWDTAAKHYTIEDDGLSLPWSGRVWLNPPYNDEIADWMRKLADHGNGIALIFARTETDCWHRYVWERASAVLFFRGRLHFHRVDGSRAKANAGAPSALVAYGDFNVHYLHSCNPGGKVIDLREAN